MTIDLTTICLHINWKAHVAGNLSFIVKNVGVLKVTGSHVTSEVVVS